MKAPRPLLAAVLLLAAGLATWQLWKHHVEPSGPGHSAAPAKLSAPPARRADPAPAHNAQPPPPAAHPRAAPGMSPASAAATPDPAPALPPPAPVVRRRFAPAPAAARLPLVFALPPEETTGLNPRQAAAAIAIADQFYQTIGGDTADPSTADYKDRWKREQPLADYQLRAAIGAQAYARWQEEAYLRQRAAAR